MPQPRRRAGFPQKTKLRRLITEVSLADDLQCNQTSQIDVERLVSDAHCTATQLNRFPIFALDQLIVLKSFRCLLRCRIDRFLQRRLAGSNPASKTLAQHAYRTEFHRFRELVAADRAGALGLRAHGPNRPSAAMRAESNTTLPRAVRNRPAAAAANDGPASIASPFI